MIHDIMEIDGVYIGHATNEAGGTGCTVIVCPAGATPGVDVRGGAPATRETDLLKPEETVDKVHAVVLSGGSAYGLAACSGVMHELERRRIGLDTGFAFVPIVSSACLYDLCVGDPKVRPGELDGVAATIHALDEEEEVPLPQGNVGAGTGCTVGKLGGMDCAMKGGLGTAVVNVGALAIGAVAAVNAVGNVYDPENGDVVAGLRENATSDTIISSRAALLDRSSRKSHMPLRMNTTISCVVTNANLTKAQATKVAQMAADGYARSIDPVHTTNDGDTVFVLATGEVNANVDVVGQAAAEAVAKAIANGCKNAHGAYGIPGAADATE